VVRRPPSRAATPLRLYGEPSGIEAVPWSWVDHQLGSAASYWVVGVGSGHPHPRPVWGVWDDPFLDLSIGSPVLSRQLAADPRVTVHLDAGTEVVILEGSTAPLPLEEATASLAAYDAKYDWRYRVDEHGPLTRVTPSVVLAWQSAGWAGRGGFRRTGRWHFT
jgi:hypothetical protein